MPTPKKGKRLGGSPDHQRIILANLAASLFEADGITTTVAKDHTARTVAANNIVNSGAMVAGAAAVVAITALGATVLEILLLVPAMCLVAAWLAQKLHRACD